MLATCHRRQRPRYSILEPQTMVNKAPPFWVHLKGYPFKGPFTNHPYLSFYSFCSLIINLFIYIIFTHMYKIFIDQFIYLYIFFHRYMYKIFINSFIYSYFLYIHTQNYNHEKKSFVKRIAKFVFVR